MNKEQLLQEARKEAEKVYPFKSDWSSHNNTIDFNQDRRLAYVQGYIANAKKRESEAVELNDIIISASQNTESNEGEKWVSVDDRLPEAYETIISYNIHTDEVSTDYIDDEKRWDVLNPTHWMPLPQAPKEK